MSTGFNKTKQSVDLGLAVIDSLRGDYEKVSVADIAEICECSTKAIYLIEREALKKSRRKFEAELNARVLMDILSTNYAD